MELERKIKLKKDIVNDMEILAKIKNTTLDVVVNKFLEYALYNLDNNDRKSIELYKES